jgi:hypothetical protein
MVDGVLLSAIALSGVWSLCTPLGRSIVKQDAHSFVVDETWLALARG